MKKKTKEFRVVKVHVDSKFRVKHGMKDWMYSTDNAFFVEEWKRPFFGLKFKWVRHYRRPLSSIERAEKYMNGINRDYLPEDGEVVGEYELII